MKPMAEQDGVQNSKAEGAHTYAIKRRDADYKGKILEQHLDGT